MLRLLRQRRDQLDQLFLIDQHSEDILDKHSELVEIVVISYFLDISFPFEIYPLEGRVFAEASGENLEVSELGVLVGEGFVELVDEEGVFPEEVFFLLVYPMWGWRYMV